jgi:hypothetical protein
VSGRAARPATRRSEGRYPDDDDQPSSGRRLSPGLVFLVIAVIGAGLYMAYAVNVRDASQIPLLASGTVVLGLTFLALAAYSLRATWRAGQEGRGGRALLIALIGGGAAMAAAGSIAAAIILFRIAAGPG